MTEFDSTEKNLNFILFVDDEQICHHMMDLIIPHFTNFKLIHAHSAAEALAIGLEHPNKICLVLSDMLMQEMSGYDLYKIFQKNDNLKHIPFIFQSGVVFDEDFKKEFTNQNVGFIYKPYKQAELFQTISDVLKVSVEKVRYIQNEH